jgi:hypothetical protein
MQLTGDFSRIYAVSSARYLMLSVGIQGIHLCGSFLTQIGMGAKKWWIQTIGVDSNPNSGFVYSHPAFIKMLWDIF